MDHDGFVDSPAVISLVRHKARRLIGHAGFTASDVPDLEQALLAHLVRAAKHFDPAKASFTTFARSALDREAVSLGRINSAAKRNPRRAVSLHVTIQVTDEESTELAQQIRADEAISHRQVQRRDEHDSAQLCHDIHVVIQSLPPKERCLAEALKHESPSEIARRMGIPRTSLYWSLQKICRRFEDAGLRHYLG